MTELYSSRNISQPNQPGSAHGFTTPTVFNGQVFMGTDKGLWVFGICNGQCKN